MLDVFSLIFVADTKIIFRYDFVAPLNFLFDRHDLNQIMTSLENPKNSILLIRIS